MLLTATITAVTAASVSVAYTVTNDGADVIYVADAVAGTDAGGARVLSAKRSYAMLRAGNVLWLAKELIAIPAGMKVESPELPYYVEVKPGGIHSGTIELEQPVRAQHPYIAFSHGTDPLQVHEIVVRIGYLSTAKFARGEFVVGPTPLAGKPYFQPDYGNGLKRQQVASVTLRPTGQVLALPATAKR